MEKATLFIKNNYWSVLVGLLFYGLYLYCNYEGNSLCDCESTENYRPAQGSHTSINHFYHK